MEIARREPFSIMSGGRKRPLETLRERYQAELVAVRRLLAEAAAVLPTSSPPAPCVRVKDDRPAEAEEPPAKKRKASPPVPVKKLTSKQRNQLYADLAKVAKLSESHVLPAHILELLKKHSRRGICDDYIEIEMHAVHDEALVEMQKQLDKFVRERANPSTHQHKNMMIDDEDEDVDIVGGVSPLPIRTTPLQLVKEDEEYVDICGHASPAVKNLGQDATISGSSSGSGSGSDSSHQSIDSRAANTRPPTRELIARANKCLERRRKEATSRARDKARQELLETERTAMFNDTQLDEDIKALGIDQHNTARPDNLLRRMGLVLKADDHDLKQQQQSFQEDLEEGEIRL